jgi:hypothetical protein
MLSFADRKNSQNAVEGDCKKKVIPHLNNVKFVYFCKRVWAAMLSDLSAQCGGPKYGENVNNASQAEQIGVALHFSKQQGRKGGFSLCTGK